MSDNQNNIDNKEIWHCHDTSKLKNFNWKGLLLHPWTYPEVTRKLKLENIKNIQ